MSSIKINKFALSIITPDGEQKKLSSIIGVKQNGVKVTSDYPELIGQVLNKDNYTKCKIEIDEEE